MDDLISREKLKRKFCGHCEDYGNCKEQCFDMRIIDSMPTEEKKGKWKHRRSWSMYVCDQCSFENREASKYCPNCGAKMEDKNETD